MEVTLEQLVGQRAVKDGVETVRQPIDRVRLDGRFIGWLARRDNAKFTPVVPIDPVTTDEIVAELVKLRAEHKLTVDSEAGRGAPSGEAVREYEESQATEEGEDE